MLPQKKMQFNALWCFFAYYIRAPRPVPSHAICSGPFLNFLAYYIGAPSDHFLRIEYGGPLRSVSSLIKNNNNNNLFRTIVHMDKKK